MSKQQRAILDHCYKKLIEQHSWLKKRFEEYSKGVNSEIKDAIEQNLYPSAREHNFWSDSLIKEIYHKRKIKPGFRVSFSRSLKRLEVRGLIIRHRKEYWRKGNGTYEGRHIEKITLTNLGWGIAGKVHYREAIKYEEPKTPKTKEQEINEFLKKTKKRLRKKKSVTVTRGKMDLGKTNTLISKTKKK